MSINHIIQISAAFVGTLGFGILFNIRGKRLIAAALGGLFSWLLFVVLQLIFKNEVINYFVVAFVLSIYAEIVARILKTPTTAFITTTLIPLIPGGSLYYTMSYIFESDMTHFLEKAVDTLKLATALSLGIILASTLTRLFLQILKHIKTKGE